MDCGISDCEKRTGIFGAYAAATIAVVLAKDLDADTLERLSALLTAVADILALIAVERE